MNDSLPSRVESSSSNSAHQEDVRSAAVPQNEESMDASDHQSMANIDPEQVRVRRIYSGDFSAPLLAGQMASDEATTLSTSTAQPVLTTSQPTQVNKPGDMIPPQPMVCEEQPSVEVPEELQDNDGCFEEWPETNMNSTDNESSDDLEVGGCPLGTSLTDVTDTPATEVVDPSSRRKRPSKHDRDFDGPCPGDPFAPRTGKCLIWRNVNMTLVRTNGALYDFDDVVALSIKVNNTLTTNTFLSTLL